MAIEQGRIEKILKREQEVVLSFASSYPIHSDDQFLTKLSILLIVSQLVNLEHRFFHVLLVDIARFDRQQNVLFVVLRFEDFYGCPVELSDAHAVYNSLHLQWLIFLNDDVGLSTSWQSWDENEVWLSSIFPKVEIN